MSTPPSMTVVALCALFLSACASPGPRNASDEATVGRPTQARTLRIAIRVEPTTIASKSPGLGSGVTLGTVKRIFDADLILKDSNGMVVPYLAESLPQLNTDSWKVFPDGRMETTYRLKPNLVWHDGTPLSTLDFVFSWRAYSLPELGVSREAPLGLFEDVSAPDERTIVIKWQKPYADAGIISTGLPPLPRHVLEAPLRDGTADAFAAHPYWTREFIGLGPFRLTAWEPGAFIEGAAFEQHIWGRPRIDRLHMIFISDPNTALANILAGELDLAADTAIQFQGGVTLKQQWGPSGGSILFAPTLFRQAAFQLRPELANPPAILDVRVRKALAHAANKQELNDLLFDGEGLMADTTPIPPGPAYYREMEQGIERFPYDVRRTQQLMTEAGYRLAPDGLFAGPDGKLTLDVKTNATVEQEREMTVLAAGWRKAGFDFRETVNPAALAQDNEARATFPGLFASSGGFGETTLAGFSSDRIPNVTNRWQGGNRGGWTNTEFDRLSEQFTTSLDRAARDRLVLGMARLYAADLPTIALHFPPTVMAAVAALTGPMPYTADGTFSFNIHEWQFK